MKYEYALERKEPYIVKTELTKKEQKIWQTS